MRERFSASVAGRHMACHASADLEAAIPGYVPPLMSAGVAAQAGTDKHAILEKIWELPPVEIQQMIDVQQYVHDLLKGRRFKKLIEHKFTAKWLQSKPKTTPDLILYTQEELHILDTKMGRIPVSAVDNPQLKFYALCAIEEGYAPKAKGVTVHILQPAANHFESCFVDTEELAEFMLKAQATEAAIAAGSTTFGPSDYCTFCDANPHKRGKAETKGKPSCPAMMQILYPKVDVDEDEILNG